MIALIATGAICLLPLGLACAIAALVAVRKHGRKGILLPATLGLALNGLLLAFVLTNFLTARHRAKQPPVGEPALGCITAPVCLRFCGGVGGQG
jgi:hypothetical protein